MNKNFDNNIPQPLLLNTQLLINVKDIAILVII